MTSEQYERWSELPNKKYKVYYSGGIVGQTVIEAPNKTMARVFTAGELNPWCNITKIEEV